jgi:D-alanine-D-alanine ligase
LALLFGGKSGEHEVSIASANSIYNALDKSKYEVILIGIDKSGRWLLPIQSKVLTHSSNPLLVKLNKEKQTVSMVPFEAQNQLMPLEPNNSPSPVGMKFDVVMPVLHGTFGEDGTIQGLLELANIPYVGSGVLGSAVGMDKEVARRLLRDAGVPVVPFKTLKRHEFNKNPDATIAEVTKTFGFPHFVKPANMGSSVGVNKVKNEKEARAKYENAFAYDTKVLAEKGINARELEIAVLGNHEPKASCVGEVIPHHEFYSYEAKYVDENGADLKAPAEELSPELITKIQKYAIQAFKALECRGMARVDFFLDKDTGEIYLNEINTIPGFTKISMYPRLWEASGLPYSKLLDELIDLAVEIHKEKNSLKTSYEP